MNNNLATLLLINSDFDGENINLKVGSRSNRHWRWIFETLCIM